MARVVIIGAGLTGLSAAYFLERNNFYDYVIYEKNEEIGGLCRSFRKDGFTFDYTGHFFHGNSPDVMNMLDAVIGQKNCAQYLRNSSIFSHGVYSAYPYQSNLYGLPTSLIIECIEGFINKPLAESTYTFESWVMKYFGSGFARHFFFPYQEKIFDFPVSQLTSSWVKSIPQTTISEILEGALEKRNVHSIGYNAHFMYPEQGGIDHLINGIARSLKNNIRTQHQVIAIDSRRKTVMFNTGTVEPYEYLISTMPLNNLLTLIKEGIKKPYTEQASKLLCNTVININVGIPLNDSLKYHWVYYPEKKFPFFRIGFPHTLCNMVPQGHVSISAEIALLKDIDKVNVDDIIKKTVQHLAHLFNFSQSSICVQQVLILNHAYVIYDNWREKYLNSIHDSLKNHAIFSIGRYGAWRYSSMQDDIIDGRSTAHTIISMMKQDLRGLMVEQCYNSLKEML